jgi:cell division septum initiation protein DivIVA
MASKVENSTCVVFRRGFRGYKKREVEEYISRMTQENAIAEENYRERIALLVRESEQAAQLLQALQADKDRLLSDCDEYKKQLKEQGETIHTLNERLDLLGSETERLQNENAKQLTFIGKVSKEILFRNPRLDKKAIEMIKKV